MFSKSIKRWSAKTKSDITKVRRRAIVKLGEEMARTIPQGGKVPFLTGSLARSLLASTNASISSGNNVGIVAATISDNQPVWLGYQANYARRMNYGFIGKDSLGRVYNQKGHYFVEGAIAEWDNIVEDAAREVRGRR